MVRSYFSAYSVTILCASLKEMVSFAPWKQFSIVGILACQQAVFWSTSETNSITILLSHCLALPYWQRGAERRLELKSGLSHTFTLPSQSTPTMSSLGRKLPTSVCNFSKPVNALTNTYRLYGSGTSLMTLSRQGVCQRQTLASTLHPQQVSSLVSQKYLVATMASCCIRQRKDCMYCWQWSPWRVSWYCSMRSLVRTFLKSLQCPCRAFLRTDGGSGISCQCSLAMRGRRWASDQLEPIRVVKQIIVIYFPISAPTEQCTSPASLS